MEKDDRREMAKSNDTDTGLTSRQNRSQLPRPRPKNDYIARLQELLETGKPIIDNFHAEFRGEKAHSTALCAVAISISSIVIKTTSASAPTLPRQVPSKSRLLQFFVSVGKIAPFSKTAVTILPPERKGNEVISCKNPLKTTLS